MTIATYSGTTCRWYRHDPTKPVGERFGICGKPTREGDALCGEHIAQTAAVEQLRAQRDQARDSDAQNWKCIEKVRAALGVPHLENVVEWAQRAGDALRAKEKP